MTISYEKTFQGAWKLSAVYQGQYFTKQYFGYTKREAAKEFRNEVKQGKGE